MTAGVQEDTSSRNCRQIKNYCSKGCGLLPLLEGLKKVLKVNGDIIEADFFFKGLANQNNLLVLSNLLY